MECSCSRHMAFAIKDVVTFYKEKQITVTNVYMLVCDAGHTKLSRHVRLRLKESVKKAYEMGVDVTDFNLHYVEKE